MTTEHPTPATERPTGAEAHWDGTYRETARRWSGRPNPVLVDVAGTLVPGRALDLGCGEGGDACWLAERGFTVTAVDVSATALERTSAHAVEAGVSDRVTVARHDLADTFPAGVFDLVSAQYLHSPVDMPRAAILRRAAAAVAPGGMLLLVGHAALPPWAPNPDADISFPTPQEVLTDLALPTDTWHVQQAEVTSREATGPGGRTGVLTDSVVALVRIA